jgi:hypothetical protein
MIRCLGLAAAFSVAVCSAAAAEQNASPARCEPGAAVVRVPELYEGSGVAASRKTPGRFWAHNDSGEPVLFALDRSGKVTGKLQLAGAAVEDWEAITVGPCASGSCIFVGDIGDNDAERARITIYRVAEPGDKAEGAQKAEAFHATYPDGSHDAESLLVAGDGRLHIVTKGDTGPVALYRFPSELRSGSVMRLEKVGQSRGAAASQNDRITDGDVSPDGQWVALRSTASLTFYRAGDLLAGNWREAGRVALGSLGEPQGEGVAFGADNVVYLVGEGGGKSRPGTFAQMNCTMR